MPDRVKAAVFDMLGSYFDCPGRLPDVDVADVFAGSGSMGLEALSRGAAFCCFLERDPAALDALNKNVDALGTRPRALIVAGDAWRGAVACAEQRCFDLVFLDPPYADSADDSESGAVCRYLRRLDRVVDQKPLVVLHHHRSVRFAEVAGDPWRVVKQRTFGTNTVTFFAQ